LRDAEIFLYFSRYSSRDPPHLPSFPTRRSSDLAAGRVGRHHSRAEGAELRLPQRPALRRGPPDRHPARQRRRARAPAGPRQAQRSEEHTSELQSRENLVCRLLLEKKNINIVKK